MSLRERLRPYLGRRSPLWHILRRGCHRGYCPVCEDQTWFYWKGVRLRSDYRCIRCGSNPRWRAIAFVLSTYFPNWPSLAIHESSPGGPTHALFERRCENYTPTHFYPDCKTGQMVRGCRCEDLGKLTFADETFDLTITQDVFEHLPDPIAAFREIARTLRPGGAHVFTLPWNRGHATQVRTKIDDREQVEHILPPVFHGNPIDDKGSLVFTDWGDDLFDTIFAATGMSTMIISIKDRSMAIDGAHREIFVCRKPCGDTNALLNRW